MKPRLCLKPLVYVAAMLVSSSAFGHVRFFVAVTEWFTPAMFEKELELKANLPEGGPGVFEIELEYGVTDRYTIAPYLVVDSEAGRLRARGWKFEQRYRFGELEFDRVLPAVYFEVKRIGSEPVEIEGKLVGSYMSANGWVGAANLVVEQELEKGHTPKWGYAAGVSRQLDGFHVGLEALGNWKKNQHWIGPSIGFGSVSNVKVIAAALYEHTGRGGHQLRLLFEHEF